MQAKRELDEPGSAGETVLPLGQAGGPPGFLGRPVGRLMAAVLSDAIDILADPRVRRGSRVHRETADWLWSDERLWPFSFLTLCDALDVDPEAVRDTVRRAATDELGRPRGKEEPEEMTA